MPGVGGTPDFDPNSGTGAGTGGGTLGDITPAAGGAPDFFSTGVGGFAVDSTGNVTFSELPPQPSTGGGSSFCGVAWWCPVTIPKAVMTTHKSSSAALKFGSRRLWLMARRHRLCRGCFVAESKSC